MNLTVHSKPLCSFVGIPSIVALTNLVIFPGKLVESIICKLSCAILKSISGILMDFPYGEDFEGFQSTADECSSHKLIGTIGWSENKTSNAKLSLFLAPEGILNFGVGIGSFLSSAALTLTTFIPHTYRSSVHRSAPSTFQSPFVHLLRGCP